MKALLLLLLLMLLVPIPAPATEQKFAGKKLNWLEKRYRKMGLDRVATAERKLADAQARMSKAVAAQEYPDQQKEIVSHKSDIAISQKDLDGARDELKKTDELLTRALADKDTRRQFNTELKAALEKENRQTAADNSLYRSAYPYPYSSTFTVRCYSGGFGRYFWVRCTSRSY